MPLVLRVHHVDEAFIRTVGSLSVLKIAFFFSIVSGRENLVKAIISTATVKIVSSRDIFRTIFDIFLSYYT